MHRDEIGAAPSQTDEIQYGNDRGVEHSLRFFKERLYTLDNKLPEEGAFFCTHQTEWGF